MRTRMAKLDPARTIRWVVLFLIAVTAIIFAAAGHGDWANIVLALAVLLVAVDTLNATLPKPADLYLEREARPSSPDLIFYLVPTPANGAIQWPRDFLLNLDVAVINVGGRKTVLTSLDLIEFQDRQGRRVQPLTFTFPLSGTLIRQRRGFVATAGVGGQHFETTQDLGPFVIEPDDALTLRCRWRGGIDWVQPRWSLDEIHDLATSLERPIARALLRAKFRRGRSIEEKSELVDVSVEQQDLYRVQLQHLTNIFTTMPNNVPPGMTVTIGGFE